MGVRYGNYGGEGLGLEFALQNAHRLRTNGFTYLSGHKISLPRYYRDKLEIEVDYENIPKPSKEVVQERFDYVNRLFEEDMHSRGVNITPTANNLNNISRLFERWYDNHRWQLADRVFRDFEQRQKMRNGL